MTDGVAGIGKGALMGPVGLRQGDKGMDYDPHRADMNVSSWGVESPVIDPGNCNSASKVLYAGGKWHPTLRQENTES